MRTTININMDLFEKLEVASFKLNLSTNELIEILINVFRSKNTFKPIAFRGIRYQVSDPDNNWKTIHVTFKPQMYELSLDLKKVYKYSVSFIISFSIINFLDEIIKKIKFSKTTIKKVVNYLDNYLFIIKKNENIQEIIMIWGVPGEKTLINLIH